MANVLIYDVKTSEVKEYLESVNTPEFEGRDDVLINPIIPDNVPMKYLKVEKNNVIEMSVTEKAVIDKIDADNVKAEIDKIITETEAKIQTFDISTLEIITAFVQILNKRFVGKEITKDEVIAQIKANRI